MRLDLATEVECVLAVSGDKRFWAQFILLRQLRDRDTVARPAVTLRAIILDEARPYPRSVICATASRLNSSPKLGFPIVASCP